MSTSSSAADGHEEILAQFVDDLEKRGSQAIEEYVVRYPELAGRIHALMQARKAVQQARPETDPGIPERLGEFRIVREISHGGMGRIYEAVQERLNRRVAVKVIRHGRILPEARDRFLREQEVLARLHQTNIVAIHTAGEEGQLQYFAMPYIEGAALHHVVQTVLHLETVQPGSKTPSLARLASMLAAKGEDAAKAASAVPPVPTEAAEMHQAESGLREGSESSPAANGTQVPADRLSLSAEYFRSVAEVMIQAAEALHYAHGAHILHRDVKPSNLMVDTSGRCWLIDFGLAGFLKDHDRAGSLGESLGVAQGQSMVSGIMGTPQYMAPEQFESRADVRTDVWGLGATLYELLALRPAFDGKTFKEIKQRILTSGPLTPHALVRSLPVDLAAICRKAMQKEPECRYQTVREFADDLRRWVRREPVRARRAWPWRRLWLWGLRNKFLSAAIFGIVLAVLSVGTTLIHAARMELAAAEDLTRAREREILLMQLQQFRLGVHQNGWFKDVEAKAWEIAKIRGDDVLRDQYAAALAGLDAKLLPGLKTDASSVTFSRDGKRLLIGGYTHDNGMAKEPTRIWEGGIDEPRKSTHLGSGPVAFRASDNAALQLVPDPNNWFTLHLWNLDKQEMGEFKLADEPSPPGWHQRNALTLALSNDGSLVAASTVSLVDGKGRLVAWDVQSGQQVREVKRGFTALFFSPDNALLAGGNNAGMVTLWSTKQEKAGTELRVGRTEILCLAFGRNPLGGAEAEAEDRWLLAVGDAGSAVTIWNLRTKQRTACRGSVANVNAVTFSPDSTILASAGRNEAKLWDVTTGQLLLNLISKPYRNWLTGLAFSPDGRRLATSSVTAFDIAGGVDIWQLEDGRGIQTLRGLANPVHQISSSPDDRLLAALDDNWQVGIWDLESGRRLLQLDVPPGYYTGNAGLAISPNGDRFAFCTKTVAKLWEIATGKELGLWSLPPARNDLLAFDPKGNRLLLVRLETEDRELPPLSNVSWEEHPRVIRAYNLLGPSPTKAFVEIKQFKRHAWIWAIAPDASYFVLEGIPDAADPLRHTVTALDGISAEKPILSLCVQLPPHHRQSGVSIDPTGALLALKIPTNEKPNLTLWELPAGKMIKTIGRYGVMSAGAKYWIASPHISLYREQEDRPIVTLDLEGISSNGSAKVRFAPHSNRFAVGNQNGTITVYDMEEIHRQLSQLGLVR